MNIVSTTDPISFKELHGCTDDLPCYVDGRGDDYLTVYFESEANRQEYLAIPTEPSSLDLSSDSAEWVDEG
ncbi:MAG: hypothetical protein HQL84_06795 [Magnetococcales bacterium]|nr:hypothetical protein [Magnetococcales bacterium]MBF0149740.1 hypothetical protein [Magnetococcales bacterium]MBF0174527.1 hypothetical protein [Magnetococcales bacterium]MBF0348159.1 hypothetical protein [Magnetococcales bacterium]MBF0630699.1 hypothetical protein [Magnetococcales bacterium]